MFVSTLGVGERSNMVLKNRSLHAAGSTPSSKFGPSLPASVAEYIGSLSAEQPALGCVVSVPQRGQWHLPPLASSGARSAFLQLRQSGHG